MGYGNIEGAGVMATTRLQLRDRAKAYLDDIVAIYSDAQLDSWLDEGLRRMSPVLLRESGEWIGVDPGDVRAEFSEGVVEVLRVYDAVGSVEVPAWRTHGIDIVFESPLPNGLTAVWIETLTAWPLMGTMDASETYLADFQTDALVFYAVARAFRQLAINRSDYRKYSTVVNNRVDLAELQQLAADWEAEFEKARAESRTRRQIMYESQRQGGSVPRGE
jgi:hypothetical protein